MRRLKTRDQFQAVMAGERVAGTSHFVLHRCSLQPAVIAGSASEPASEAGLRPARPLFPVTDEACVGTILPKRWARHAVTRNAIRRQVYGAAGRAEAVLGHAAYVVRLRSGFDREHYPSASSDALKQAVARELDTLFARLRRNDPQAVLPVAQASSP